MGIMDPNVVIVKENELEGPKRNMCVCVCKNVCVGGRGCYNPPEVGYNN